jgi:putative tricarboxylic transport membrane protein
LTQKGQAGKAVGAAVLCSALGGFASALLMIIATPLIASWAVRQFGPPEVFALIFFGLTVAASVGAKTLWKGWLSVLLGLLIATVGTDPAGGYARFSFGTYYLLAGVSFIPMVLGFFAISEVFIQGEKMVTGTRKAPKVSLDFPSFAEFWRLKIAVLRSMVIGFFAGILPGIGAVLAAFMSYSVAVRWSRHPEKFGTGELEGVVASETANNAATGAAMIPLLALGLPGGALTAMMLGVFQIHGMEPGPLIFVTSKDLVWTTFSAMLFANVAILGLGWLQTKTVVHLLAVPFRFLSPAILLLATIGAYALRNLIVDVWVMFVAGIIGYFLRRSGYSVAGIVLGLVLGDLGEAAFVKTMQLTGYSLTTFLNRPVCGALVAVGVLTLLWNFYSELRRKPPAAA